MSKDKESDFIFYLNASRKNKTTGLKFRKKCLVVTDKAFASKYDRNKMVEMACARGVSFEVICAKAKNAIEARSSVVDINSKSFPTDTAEFYSMLDSAHKSFVENVPSEIREKYGNDAFRFYSDTKDYTEQQYYDLFKEYFNPSTLTNTPQPITQEVKEDK